MKRILIISVSAAALMCAATSWAAKTAIKPGGLKTNEQKLSYSLGAETGKAFKTHNVKIDPKAFAAGMSDAISGAKLQITDAQMRVIIKQFQEDSVKRFEARMKREAAKNLQLGNAFLAENKSKSGVKSLVDGLQYKVLKQGTGPSPTANDIVTVNYEGMLIDKRVFDSSYKRGKPATFPVKGVIKGWQLALPKMKVGSTWELYVPADLAYGKMGAPGIGPNQVLIFKIHLISIKK